MLGSLSNYRRKLLQIFAEAIALWFATCGDGIRGLGKSLGGSRGGKDCGGSCQGRAGGGAIVVAALRLALALAFALAFALALARNLCVKLSARELNTLTTICNDTLLRRQRIDSSRPPKMKLNVISKLSRSLK